MHKSSFFSSLVSKIFLKVFTVFSFFTPTKQQPPTYFIVGFFFFHFAHFPWAGCWHIGDGNFSLVSFLRQVTVSIRLQAKKSIFFLFVLDLMQTANMKTQFFLFIAF